MYREVQVQSTTSNLSEGNFEQFSSREWNKTRKISISISSSYNVSFFFSGVVLIEISEVHKKVQLELEETVSMQYDCSPTPEETVDINRYSVYSSLILCSFNTLVSSHNALSSWILVTSWWFLNKFEHDFLG